MNAVAKVPRAGQRRRRGSLVALLCLPLLAGFATGAHAQTLSVSPPANADEGDSGTRVLEFPVTLSSAVSSTVLYKLCFSGTATIDLTQVNLIPASADYQVVDTSGDPPAPTSTNCINDSIAPNSVSATHGISIRVKGDTIPESDETVVATLSGLLLPSGVTLGTSTATHTIRNDDGAVPEITISGGAAVTEGGTARFTVNANPAPSVNVKVSFTISEDTSGGQEFLHPSVKSIGVFASTISANQTSATFDLLTSGDSTDEPNGRVTLTLSAGLGYTIGTPSSASMTVNDNDAPTLSIRAPSPARANEGNYTRNLANNFQVSLSAETVIGNVDFRVCFSGTATLDTDSINDFPSGTDYQVFVSGNNQHSNCADGQIRSGRTSTTTPPGIRINGDTVFEPDETVIATLTLRGSPPPDVSVGTATATYTILNDDLPPYSTTDFITPSANADLAGPEGDRQHFAILRNVVTSSGIVPSSNAYGFQLCFTGTARPNVDYSVANHANHPLEIDQNGCSKANDGDQGTARPAGFDRTNFYINYLRDGETEGDESIIVTLKNAMGTRLYGDNSRKVSYGNSLTFTIKDPAPQPKCEAARSTDSYARSTYGALIDKMCEWSDREWGNDRRRWDRALLAFGVGLPRYSQSACQAERDGDDDRHIRAGRLQDYSCGPMKAEEAQVYADKPWRGWYEEVGGHTVASALRDLESRSPQMEGGVGDGDSTKDGDTDNMNAQTDNTQQPPDYGELKARVKTWAGEQDANSDHARRWNRVLAALGDPDAIDDGYSPMTAAEAQTYANRGWTRWDDVVAALTELETRAAAETQAETEPEPPPPDPELSLSAGSAVDEGASASFTIHADAAPAADLTVSVSVAQSGDWLDSPGAGTRTVTLAAGATTASIDVATVNDGTDEPDGSVSVTLGSGAGYTVAASPNDTASVTVRDDDDPPPPPPPAVTQGTCVSVPQWKTVKGYYDANANRSPNYGANWYRVLIAYRQDRGDQTLPAWVGQTAEPTAAYTAEEAEDGEKVWSGWTPVRIVLQCLEKTYGSSTDSVIGGVPPMGQSGEVGTANPDEARERNRWNPLTDPAGFEPDAMPDFAAGACVSPQLRSDAVARANETWRGAAHVERWLRVARTFSGGANDATVVTPSEAGFHAATGQPGWLPVADALRCMEQQSLREALSR